MANRFCTSCGAPLEEDKKFCTACGAPAAAEGNQNPAQEPAAAPQPARASAPAAVQAPTYQEPPPQAAYAPAQPAGKPAGLYAPIGTLGWLGIMLLLLIPIVNIILLIVWAVGGCQKAVKRSFARATLIFLVISIVLGLVVGHFAKQAINSFLQESGITQQFGDIPGGMGVEDLFGALTGEDVPGLTGGAQGSGGGMEALDALFPDGVFDEQILVDAGCSPEEIEMFRAVMANDRQALLDMGYSEQEVDMVLQMFQ